MQVNLDSLEGKVTHVLALCRHLGAEAHALRVQVADLQAERDALADKIKIACDRLESLKARLPQE
jgi:uncharacterized protein (TIGR02449 family)